MCGCTESLLVCRGEVGKWGTNRRPLLSLDECFHQLLGVYVPLHDCTRLLRRYFREIEAVAVTNLLGLVRKPLAELA